jgi:hypothetical protein
MLKYDPELIRSNPNFWYYELFKAQNYRYRAVMEYNKQTSTNDVVASSSTIMCYGCSGTQNRSLHSWVNHELKDVGVLYLCDECFTRYLRWWYNSEESGINEDKMNEEDWKKGETIISWLVNENVKPVAEQDLPYIGLEKDFDCCKDHTGPCTDIELNSFNQSNGK